MEAQSDYALKIAATKHAGLNRLSYKLGQSEFGSEAVKDITCCICEAWWEPSKTIEHLYTLSFPEEMAYTNTVSLIDMINNNFAGYNVNDVQCPFCHNWETFHQLRCNGIFGTTLAFQLGRFKNSGSSKISTNVNFPKKLSLVECGIATSQEKDFKIRASISEFSETFTDYLYTFNIDDDTEEISELCKLQCDSFSKFQSNALDFRNYRKRKVIGIQYRHAKMI